MLRWFSCTASANAPIKLSYIDQSSSCVIKKWSDNHLWRTNDMLVQRPPPTKKTLSTTTHTLHLPMRDDPFSAPGKQVTFYVLKYNYKKVAKWVQVIYHSSSALSVWWCLFYSSVPPVLWADIAARRHERPTTHLSEVHSTGTSSSEALFCQIMSLTDAALLPCRTTNSRPIAYIITVLTCITKWNGTVISS